MLDGAVAAIDLTMPSDPGEPANEIERVRRQADRLLGSGTVTATQLDRWDAAVATYGRSARRPQDHCFISSLVADFAELLAWMRDRQPTHVQVRLCHAAAQLAGLISLTLMHQAEHRHAHNWARTASLSADETGQADIRSWARAYEAHTLYSAGSDGLAVLDAARDAQSMSAAAPTAGAALGAALEAQLHARTGDRAAALTTLAEAERIANQLGEQHATDSAFTFSLAQLHHYRGSALAVLGDSDEAWKAQTLALALYPATDAGRLHVLLDRAVMLAHDGDTASAASQAIGVLDQDAARPSALVRARTRDLLDALNATDTELGPEVASLADAVAGRPRPRRLTSTALSADRSYHG
jgi:tetratricopeptide (TPR) repeat protein